MASGADEIELVVVAAADEGGGYQSFAAIRDFAYKSVGRPTAVGDLIGAGGDGEVVASSTAADEEVVGRIDVDAIDGVVRVPPR